MFSSSSHVKTQIQSLNLSETLSNVTYQTSKDATTTHTRKKKKTHNDMMNQFFKNK